MNGKQARLIRKVVLTANEPVEGYTEGRTVKCTGWRSTYQFLKKRFLSFGQYGRSRLSHGFKVMIDEEEKTIYER